MAAARILALLLLLVACLAQSGCSNEPAGSARAERGTLLWAVGDGATGGEVPRQIAALVAREHPLRVIYLGDVYDRGTAEEFERNFHAPYRRLVRRMWPTPGNHEWPTHAEGYDPYWKRIRGRPFPPWYERSIAGWQVLSLNSEAPHDEGSPQLRWLRSRLAGPGTCRIAFWHRPRFSAGAHGDQEDVEPLWSAVRGRAALVLNGHDHDLQRLEPIDGTVEVVVGAGGRERTPVDRSDRRLAFSDDEHFGALRLELRDTSATLTFVAADGLTLDRSTVSCRR